MLIIANCIVKYINFNQLKPIFNTIANMEINTENSEMNNHKKIASDIFLQLSQNVTPDDRKKAMKEFDLSHETVRAYLSGNARNLDTAEKLIVFFRAAIKKREKVFSNQ